MIFGVYEGLGFRVIPSRTESVDFCGAYELSNWDRDELGFGISGLGACLSWNMSFLEPTPHCGRVS